MATYTTRMGLTKPAGAEARSNIPLNTNSDLLDKFLPCILVNDGVTPPTGDLYDGALVKEKTSGIIWEARKNGGGTYDKVYVRYPFIYDGGTYTSQAVANNGWPNFITVGVATTDTAACKNSSAANISAGKFVVPVKGIYQVSLLIDYVGNATGNRGICLEVNGAYWISTPFRNTTKEVPNVGASSDAVVDLSFPQMFSVNDTVAIGTYQNSGASLNLAQDRIRMVMIEPVQ